jgi:starch synthase (maltosyl-transferring)
MDRPSHRSSVAQPSQLDRNKLEDSLRRRVVISEVQPSIDRGRFPIKRTVGERVEVTTVIIADGHDLLTGVLKYRDARSDDAWHEVPLEFVGNDRWRASFVPTTIGTWEYTVEAWVDRFSTWLKGLEAKASDGQDVSSELVEGAELIQASLGVVSHRPVQTTVAGRASAPDVESGDDSAGSSSETDLRLLEFADRLRGSTDQRQRVADARSPDLRQLITSRNIRTDADVYEPPLQVTVDPVLARFSTWYEMFPRSCTSDPARSGTFREAELRLADIAAMGFDVLYLPPIHPIGTTHRKGRNNALTASPDDPGSPWAIGGDAGGHTSIHPELGTLDDFDRFVHVANRLGLEVALDIAFQASPDHPWVREHPEWFRHRPDGSIKYAENPPKKYQDIYPFDFESRDWQGLWQALRDVFLFWIDHGVRVFRVDNPHTKAFRFWEWCIADIKRQHPDAIFLSEAFTRPAIKHHLAKIGFTQSYTYFTWRNTAEELRTYLTELTTGDVAEFLRPNFFTNTPDILHEYLQHGGRAAFQIRLVLAATLSSNYGIYSGFELCEGQAVRPGSEEYLDSEKYQIRIRDWQAPGNLRELVGLINQIRRSHPSLQRNDTLQFHETDNDVLLAFTKHDDNGDRLFVVVNTDPYNLQHGWVRLPLPAGHPFPYLVHDLLDDARYVWRGEWNYVRFDPGERVAHVFVIESRT